MATPLEVLARVTELIKRFDNLRVIGTGWSGNSREGFLFDADASGGGGGSMFGGGITDIPPGDGEPPGDGGPPIIIPPHPPPIPPGQFGACCCAGACTQSTRGQCGGGCTFYPGGDCFLGNPCGPVAHAGACCFDDRHCEVVPATECTGTFLGNDTTCVGVNCADVNHSGACCCPPNNCVISPATGCTGSGCHYLGDGSSCSGVDCGNTYYCPGGNFCAGPPPHNCSLIPPCAPVTCLCPAPPWACLPAGTCCTTCFNVISQIYYSCGCIPIGCCTSGGPPCTSCT